MLIHYLYNTNVVITLTTFIFSHIHTCIHITVTQYVNNMLKSINYYNNKLVM